MNLDEIPGDMDEESIRYLEAPFLTRKTSGEENGEDTGNILEEIIEDKGSGVEIFSDFLRSEIVRKAESILTEEEIYVMESLFQTHPEFMTARQLKRVLGIKNLKQIRQQTIEKIKETRK